MEIDLDAARKDYPDIEWSLEMAGKDGKTRCLVARKGKWYKAFAVPPHNYYTLKGKNWAKQAPIELARIIHERAK